MAVPLYKEILKAQPTLEDVVRQLCRCYARLGDSSSLIREDWHLRQALREACADLGGPEPNAADYQPGPETVALFNEIRQDLETKSVGTDRVQSDC